MNYGDMAASVTSALTLEGLTNVDSDAVRRLLNAAADVIAGVRDRFDRNWFLTRKDYTAAAGAASVTLPDGSGADAAFRRLRGAARVNDDGSETEVRVYEYGAQRDRDTGAAGFYLTREGGKLYFNAGGAPAAMTLRVRYAGRPLHLDGSDSAATYAGLEDWGGAIVAHAVMEGLPAKNRAGLEKWRDLYAQRLADLQATAAAAVDTPLAIGTTRDMR